MDAEKSTSPHELSEREKRFLERLSKKYENDPAAGLTRSYLIAAVVILVLFAMSRWITWWWAAIVVVEAIGLTLFHKYKRFGRFKTGLLTRLWSRVREHSP